MQYSLSRFALVTDLFGTLFSLYSTRTGVHSILDLEQEPALGLLRERRFFTDADFEPGVLAALVEAGYLVPSDVDELSLCELERTLALAGDYGLRMAIMLTLACNLACPYCFQDQSGGLRSMSGLTQDNLLKLAEKILRKDTKGPLIVKWFGGEPLLELEMLRALSHRFKSLAERLEVPAYFSISTNGFHLRRLTPEILDELDLSLIQVTLDGPREIHDQRRKLKGGRGTFDRILDNISTVSEHSSAITIRINIDISNYREVPDLLRELRDRGLLERCKYLPVAVHGTKGTCAADSCITLQPKEWAQVDRFLYQQAQSLGIADRLSGRYPRPVPLKCSAQVPNAFVVDPSGHLYKCITDASITSRAFFNIDSGEWLNTKRALAIRESSPFGKKRCEACQFLPLCHAGCPAEHYDGLTPGYLCTDLKFSLRGRLNEYVRELQDSNAESLGQAGELAG